MTMESPRTSTETMSPTEDLSGLSHSMRGRKPVDPSAHRILSAIRRIWRRSDLSETVVGSLSRNPWAAQEVT